MLPIFPDPIMGAQETRNWIEFNIPRKAWKELSGASILRSLKEVGMGIREQDFYGIRRKVLSLGYYEQQLQARAIDQLVPRAWMNEVPKGLLTSNALYKYKVQVANLETGEVETWTRAISSNQHLTPQEVLDFGTNLVISKLYGYNYEMMDMHVSEVWVTEGAILSR